MHERSITVERDGQHFLESSVEEGKVLEGPFLNAADAEDAAQARDARNQIEQSAPEPNQSVPAPAQTTVPEPQEFLDAAVIIAGPEEEIEISTKLNAIYLETGRAPADVVAETMVDPTIRDDLMSDRVRFPRAYGIPEPIMPPDPPRGIAADIAFGALSGVNKAVNELWTVLGLEEFGEWLDKVSPLGVIEVPSPTGTAGLVAEPLAQTVVGMVPAARLVRAIGISTAFIQWTIAGAFADFALFHPDDPALGDLAKDIGKLENPELEAIRSLFADALAKDEDDTAVEKRLKAAVGGALVGATVDGLMALYRGSRGVVGALKRAGLDPLFMSAGGLAVIFDELLGIRPAEAGGFDKVLRVILKKIMVDNPKRMGTTGQFIGGPRGLDTPAKLAGLRRRLTNLAVNTVEGEPGSKFWYERSGKTILELMNGDVDRADKFVQVMAVLSRANKVQNNLDATLRAFDQFNAGGEVAVGRFPNKDRAEIQGILEGTADVSGLKRTAFYANLMQEIDPSRVPAGAVTVDLWMMRAFGFKTLAGKPATGASVTAQQNAFVQSEIKRIALQLGWEPHQVQSAIWVGQKAKDEGTSLAAAGLNFSAALEKNLGQLSWEAIPHRNSGHLTGIADAPPQVQADYHRAAAAAFLDRAGNDLIAKRLGVHSPLSFEAPGAFERKTGPGEQTLLQISAVTSNKPGQRIDENTKLLINVYAGLRAALLRQEAIAWFRPIRNTSRAAADGFELEGRALDLDETQALYDAILAGGGHVDWAPISTRKGFIVLNDEARSGISNKKFHQMIEDAAEAAELPPVFNGKPLYFQKEGDYLSNPDLKGDPDGQIFRGKAGEAGRSDLQETVDDLYAEISPKLDEVDQVFGEENGWEVLRRTPDPDPGGIAAGAGAPLAPPAALPATAAAAAALPLTGEEQEQQVAGLLERVLRPFLKIPQALTGKASVLSRISKGDVTPRRNRWDKFYKDIVDDLSPLNDAVKRLVGGARGALATSDDPYKLARLNRGVNGKAEHFLEYSPFKFFNFQNVGRSLKDILAPVKDNLDDIRAYAVAKRSLELRGRGIETGVDDVAARQTVADLEDRMEPIFRELVEYQDHVLNYLRDSGIVSEKTAKMMREANKDYVPFFRLMEQGEGAAGGVGGKGFGVRQPVKRIKGSERLIIDPLESIVKNTYLYLNLADRNGIGLALLRLAETHPDGASLARIVPTPKTPTRVTGAETLRANPEIKQLLEQYGDEAGVKISAQDFSVFRPNAMVVGPNEIVVYRDGKRLLLEVDPEVAKTFKALDQESAGMLVKILSVPAKLLRAGAVLSPEFIGRNPIRDQLSAFIFSQKGFVPVLDLSRGIFHMIKKDDVFKDWIKSGGPMASLVSLDRVYLQKNIRQIAGQTGLGERLINVVKSPIEALRILSDLAERGTRIGEFERVSGGLAGKVGRKEAILSGGFDSREVTLDFGRIGAKTRSVNMLIAFWNANVQGQDKIIRAFRDNPFRTTAKVGAGITLPSVVLQVLNRKFHDDPDDPNGYSKMPQWVRDLFWNVRVGDTWWRIPKPFELGIIFGTGAERIVDFILKKDPKAFDGLLDAMGRGASPGMMPTAMVPLIEQWANRSLFMNRPVIPADRERVLPEYQYSQYTTETGKALGKLMAQIPILGETRLASPAIIENYIRAWTGGLGTHVLHAADFALRKAGLVPDPPRPASTLADIPFVKGFVVRHPSAGAAPIVKFFDDVDLQEVKSNTVKALMREGQPEEAMKVMDDLINAGDLNEVSGIKKGLVNQMKTLRLIFRNPDITPDEKRQLIDEIYAQMIEMAMVGNEIIELGRRIAKQTIDLLPTNEPGPSERELESLLSGADE